MHHRLPINRSQSVRGMRVPGVGGGGGFLCGGAQSLMHGHSPRLTCGPGGVASTLLDLGGGGEGGREGGREGGKWYQ